MSFKLKITLLLTLVLAVSPVITAGACRSAGQGKIQLHVFHADSLTIPFQQIEKEFERQYPDIDVRLDGHGSIQVIRAVTDLHQDVDVAAVADDQLIPMLMYNTRMPDDGGPYADWYIDFATNALGIAYRDTSRHAADLSAANWYEILSRPDVRTGLADPRIDSLGYRALMAVQLAEGYYKDDTIFEQLFDGVFTMRIDVSYNSGVTTLTVPELLKSENARVVLRSYSLQLLALLESGDVDYSFEYESVARQHGLNFLKLPAAIDLSSREYDDSYRKVRVVMDFQRFASVNPEFLGGTITYGITMPRNAPHPHEAVRFLQFLLGPDGRRVLSGNYQPPLAPLEADNEARLPEDLRPLLK